MIKQDIDQVNQSLTGGSSNRTKVHIAHVLNDLDVGGIKTVVDSITSSTLAEHYHFSFHALTRSLWLKPLSADLIMFHNASNWKSVLRIVVIKMLNPHATLMIQEHHYTQAFESGLNNPTRFLTMLKTNYALVDSVVAVSKGQGEWLLRRALLSKSKLTVIPQRCIVDKFYELPFKPLENELVLAAYGRYHRQKGFDVLIKAARELPEVRFRLGGLGPEENKLKKMSKGLSNIEFCGLIKDVPGFLDSCHAVLIPSRFEPFGLVALEARAAGKPIIVSDVDGLPEQAKDCGVIFKSEQVSELVEAIRRLDESSLRSFSTHARESTIGGWDTYIQQWLALFKKLTTKTER